MTTASRETANAAQLIIDYAAGGTATSAPTVTTGSASNVTASSVTLSGTANPNGAGTTCHFAYGTTVGYGSVTPDQPVAASAGNTALSANLSGLSFNTSYSFRLECTNSNGTSLGQNALFRTSPGAPAVTTGAAASITASGATLGGTANDNGAAANCRFDYGPTTAYGSLTALQNVPSGSGPTSLSAAVSGLSASTAYAFRLECTNSIGLAYGNNVTFSTLAAGGGGGGHVVTTLAAVADSYIYSGAAAANFGTANPFKISAASYRGLIKFNSGSIPVGSTINSVALRLYSASSPASGGVRVHPEGDSWTETGINWGNQPAWDASVLATSGLPASGAWTAVSLPVSAVTAAGNSNYGLDFSTSGIVVSLASREDVSNGPQLVVDFTSGSASTAPSVTTGSASAITASSASLSGSVNDNGAATTCHFEYGPTTSYGSLTADQNVLAGAGLTTLNAALSSLPAGTTYNYRLTCSSAGGTVSGANASVTTLSSAPTVTTGSVTAPGSSNAMLTGTAGDSGAATNCQFDYGPTTAYGAQTAQQSIAAGAGSTNLTATVTGLTASTAYNYRLECTNSSGTTYGANATFTTAAAGAVNTVTKVLTIVEENHGYTEMLTSMPYLNGLAQQYGYATNYKALTHPSLPNYLALAGGSTFGITTDCPVSSCAVAGAQTIFDQTIAAGRTAKLYAEDMTTNCLTSGTGAGLYAVRHTAWPYFTDAASRSNCNNFQVPAGTYQAGAFQSDAVGGSLPVTGWLIPNLCNDAHNSGCTLAGADAWLQNILPVIFAGPDWKSGHLAVVVTADEDDGSSANAVLTVVMHPDLHNKVVSTALDHYSLTKFHEEAAGVTPYLNNATAAADMAQAFGLSVGP